MTTFFQRLFRGGKSGAESAEPRLTLAVFGKHPGWDDYLGSGVDTGIGVETETLAHVKHALHADGIRGQIDSGAWEKLEPEKRLEGFDHALLWLRAGHLILGQIWSSTDGKRRRYPMMLCIDGEGVAPAFLLAKARPELKRLRAACQTATTAEEVTAEWHAAQERLRTQLHGPIETDSAILLPVQARRRFLAHTALGPERLGMLRALHELGTAPGIFTNGGRPEPGGAASSRTCHLRLPLASDLRNEGLSLWAAFLQCAIPDAAPLLLISRSGVDWIDVIVGEPASDDFFWLQASLKASPLTTEIPFEISPELKPRLEQLEARFLGAEPPAAKAPEPATKAVPLTGTLAVKAPAPASAPVVTPAPALKSLVPAPAPVVKDVAAIALPASQTATPAPAHAVKPSVPSSALAKAPAPTPAPAAKAPDPAPALASKAGSPAPPSPSPQVQESAAKRKRTGFLAGGAVVAVIAAACLLWFGRGQFSTPVPLTVTADNITRAYGVANPRLTGKLAGLRPGDGITDAYQTADSRSPTGQYSIVPVLNDPNRKLGRYRVTTNRGTLTITAAPLTVTASNQTRPYGARNPLPMVAIGGLREGDDITATSSTEANAGSPAGRYDIVPLLKHQGNKLRNYTVTTNKGTLTVTRAPLTITAKNQRRAYRTPNPDLTYEISGLLNGDIIMATNHTKADLKSPVGSYEIVPELIGPANKLGNYAATRRKGILTITPAALTVTANNQDRPYGATNPPLAGWFTPNGDQISASYSTKADASSPLGVYDIRPALIDPNGKQSNYSVTITKGTLTVTPTVVPSGTGTTTAVADGETFTNGIGMEFVWLSWVPPKGVYFAKYEVTQKQFQAVMGKLPTLPPAAGDNLPVANVAFSDAQEFCNLLTAREHRIYALPSREEWLAAARLSEDQVANAWNVMANRGMLQHEVTSVTEVQKGPEAVGNRGSQTNGLCDMFGNVREWVAGRTAEERAGFSYHSAGGRTKDLFLPGSANDPWIQRETGFRCILRQ